MKGALLTVAIIAGQLAAAHVGYSRPPDQVPHSPIPPLHEPTHQPANRAAVAAPVVDPSLPPATSTPQRTDAAVTDPEQLKVWNSPDMVEARNAVTEFSRISAQTSPAEGEQFLARLSQLPPDEMLNWLQRFQTRRDNSRRSQEAGRRGNRMAVDQAVRRQEQRQQAGTNAANFRSEAAMSRLTPVPQPQPTGFKPGFGPSPFGPTLIYNPFDPVIDPMSPRGYRRRAAAAASLPGDLPRNDPRNFIRGEQGIDFGESANRPSSDTPAVPVGPPSN